ncbi:hypothetical protein Vretifemale_18489 [Volvox reticuliferus]|uniref:Uncharacterized protein n=1 Tax=Volvox reticuliferus TaxID=1737510 RepID=A0A8J4D1H0_9CHLO|nr:hypothetical protein Vretifemale_18489 [Volvox reticuliferus]
MAPGAVQAEHSRHSSMCLATLTTWASNGGVPQVGLNALAEILQAGDWGGGTGQRNRTFRYRLVGADGANAVMVTGGGTTTAGQGNISPAQLFSLATTLMPTQHRLLLVRSSGSDSAAAASVALAASNSLPLGI